MRFLLPLIAIFFFSMAVSGQTIDGLKACYGNPRNFFEIRPGVIMTVNFGLEREVCEMRLQSKSPRSNPIRTPVEVWCGGDDNLTRRVCDATVNSFTASSDFDLVDADGKKPGTLLVTVTENVDWKEIGKRTKVYYKVAFTSLEDNKLGSVKGSCWDDDFAKCGAQIMKRATVVARKLDSRK